MISARRQAEMAARRKRWPETVARAEASGLTIRQLCEENGVNEGQFYHWRHRLELEAGKSQAKPTAASEFVLVRPTRKPQPEPMAGSETAALELTLDQGWRLRIRPGVEEATLRTVLAALR